MGKKKGNTKVVRCSFKGCNRRVVGNTQNCEKHIYKCMNQECDWMVQYPSSLCKKCCKNN